MFLGLLGSWSSVGLSVSILLGLGFIGGLVVLVLWWRCLWVTPRLWLVVDVSWLYAVLLPIMWWLMSVVVEVVSSAVTGTAGGLS